MAGEANLRAGGVLDLVTGRGSSRYPWTRGKRGLIGLLRIVAATLLILPSPASAQTVTASLSGTVVDSSGAVIPGAQVSLVDEATGSKHVATANGGGHFSYTAIFPSTYDLTVTARGFSTWQARGIVLHQNESRAISDITLKPGAEAQRITVEAATETVPIDTGASSTTLNNTMVSQAAIQGRDAAELIRLMPGMAINSGLNNTEWNSALTQINSGPIGAFSANGTQPNGSMQLISNGSVITDAGNQGTQIANINQDMTQEVTIQDSAFDAEYAHGPVTFSAVGKRPYPALTTVDSGTTATSVRALSGLVRLLCMTRTVWPTMARRT